MLVVAVTCHAPKHMHRYTNKKALPLSPWPCPTHKHTHFQWLTLAGLAVVQRLAVVAGVSVLAVLAVASGSVVATLLTHTSAAPSRLLKHLHAEAALVWMPVTLTGWTRETNKWIPMKKIRNPLLKGDVQVQVVKNKRNVNVTGGNCVVLVSNDHTMIVSPVWCYLFLFGQEEIIMQ